MKKRIVLALLAVVFTAAFLSVGCGKKITEADVSYAGPMLDNALTAIQNNDYEGFSKDLSAKMKEAFTEDAFKGLCDKLNSKIGDYESKSFLSARNSKSNGMDLVTIIYKAKYSKEPSNVIITATYGDEDGAKKLMGLYFNSPNLMK